MGIRSQGDSTSKYNAVWGQTGVGAWENYVAPPGANYIEATGGNIDGAAPGNGWKYHVFTSPGTFEITNAGPTDNYCQVFLVAGGGNGGGDGAGGGCGGGGAGGLIVGTLTALPASSYAVTIGAQNPNGNSLPGNNSTFNSPNFPTAYTAYGGGRGGAAPAGATNGGSGGGGASGSPGSGGGGATSTSQSTPYGVLAGKGNDAGFGGGPGSPRVGGGGGGAGEAGWKGNVDGYPIAGPINNSADGTGGSGYPVGWAAGGDLPTMPTDWKTALGSWGHYAGGGGGSRQSPITDDKNGGYGGGAVSYTHLTLPTNREV